MSKKQKRTPVKHVQRTRRHWVVFYIALAILALIVLALWAQSLQSYRNPTGSMSLHVPYSTYLVGEPITFTLKNEYDTTIYIPNHCPSEPLAVYKLSGDDWERIHATTSEDNCPSADRTIAIEPGEQQSGSYAKWASLFKKPGTYRIPAVVDYFGVVSYQDFKVITPPKIVAKTEQTPTTTTQPAQTTAPVETTTTPAVALSEKTVSTANGSILVRYSTTTVYVISINPASGCTYEGGGSGTQVEVAFKCSGTETEVHLWVSGGQLIQKIETGD